MEDSRLDVGNGFCSIPDHRWQGYFRTPFVAPADWCGLGLRSWCPFLTQPEGGKRGEIVQLVSKGLSTIFAVSTESLRQLLINALIGQVVPGVETMWVWAACQKANFSPQLSGNPTYQELEARGSGDGFCQPGVFVAKPCRVEQNRPIRSGVRRGDQPERHGVRV
jgi:hypothetical protein